MEGHPLALARRLHAALHHRVDESVALYDELVLVEVCVEAQPQRRGEPLEPCALRQAQKLLDAFRLDDREAPPRLGVVIHRRLHAVAPLDRLEPDAVHREPVLCVYPDKLDELLLAELRKIFVILQHQHLRRESARTRRNAPRASVMAEF